MVALRNCSTETQRSSLPQLALLIALIAVVGGSVATSTPVVVGYPRADVARVASVSASPVDPTLPIAPGAWTMAAGTPATFSATLGNLPAGCTVVELQISWWLPGIASEDGFLNTSSGPRVDLLTFAGSGGPATLAASGQGEVACGGQRFGVDPTGLAEITILPSLTMGTPVVSPDPAIVGSPVTLYESIQGGLAPFAVTLDFGDGVQGSTTLSQPGSIAVTHRYLDGRYSPTWSVTDALGDAQKATPMASLVVTDLLAIVVTPYQRTVDVGVSTSFAANVSGGTPPYFVTWTSPTGLLAFGSVWTGTPQQSGVFDVRAVVQDSGGSSAAAGATLRVTSPPTVAVAGVVPAGDVGRAIPFAVNLTGGVAPFTVVWTPVGGGTNRTAELPADGWYVEPTATGSVGTLWLTVSVTDLDGARVATTAAIAQVFPPPGVALSIGSPVVEAGEPLRVGGILTGGSPPVTWSVSASMPVNGTGAIAGTVNGSGSFTWSAAPVSGGNLTVLVTTRDATGAYASANTTVSVLPPVRIAVLPLPTLTTGSSAVISADVGGGQAPYAFVVTVSDGERILGNLTGAGPADLTVLPRTSGYLEFHLLIVDGLGGRADAVLTGVSAAGPPSPGSGGSAPASASPGPPSVSGPTWVVALLGAGGVVAAILLPRRRRRKGGGSSSERAEAMHAVRRYLEESEGLDRSTLYFLAEDDGISETAADDALRRWMRAGRVQSSPGPDDEEILVWGSPATVPGSRVRSSDPEGGEA